jgi:Fe-S cluster assembly ATPase SufC
MKSYETRELTGYWRNEGLNSEYQQYRIKESFDQKPLTLRRATTEFLKHIEPVDKAGEWVTGAMLDALTLIRKSGYEKNKAPWETWYTEKGGNLKENHQKVIVRDWVSDALFPKDLLNKFGRIDKSYTEKWGEFFDNVADNAIKAPLRTFTSSFTTSFMDGLVATAGDQTAAFAFACARLTSLPVGSAMSALSFNVVNQMMGASGRLSADTKVLFSNYPNTALPEEKVRQIIEGSTAEYQYRMAQIGILSTWLGLSCGVALSKFVQEGHRGLPTSAVYSLVNALAIFGINKFLPKHLDEHTADFSSVQSKINSAVHRNQKWTDIDYRYGLSDDERVLQEARHRITYEKNFTSNAAGSITPAALSTMIHGIYGGGVAGPILILAKATETAVGINSTYVRFKSTLKQREEAIELLGQELDTLQGERGPLTDEHILPFLTEANGNYPKEFWNIPKFSLRMRSVGLPIVERIGGDLFNQVSFTENFEAPAGSFVLLSGPNGWGKSTFMRTLAGVHVGDLSKTDVRWGEYDLRSMSTEERKRRFVYLSGQSNRSLKSIVAKILVNYENALTKRKYDRSEIHKWLNSNDPFPELENEVISYFENNELLTGMDCSWFRQEKIPSGYQGAALLFASHMSIREPVVLMIDEIENGMTDQSHKLFVNYMQRAIRNFPGVVVVSANKAQGSWIRLPETYGVIDIKSNETHGVQFGLPHAEKIRDEIRFNELNTRLEHGAVLNIDEYREWLLSESGPRMKLIYKLNQIFASQPGEGQSILLALNSGLREWETGEHSTRFIKQLDSWIDSSSSLSEITKILQTTHLFFSIHSYIEAGQFISRRSMFNEEVKSLSYHTVDGLKLKVKSLMQAYGFVKNENELRFSTVRELTSEEKILWESLGRLVNYLEDFVSAFDRWKVETPSYIRMIQGSDICSFGKNLDINKFKKVISDPLFCAGLARATVVTREYIKDYISSLGSQCEVREFVVMLQSVSIMDLYSGVYTSLWNELIFDSDIKIATENRIRELSIDQN